MRKLILGLAIILFILWIYIIILNVNVSSQLVLPLFGERTIKTSWVILGFGIFTGIIDLLSCIWLFMSKTELNKNYQLKMDKMSVQADNDKSQVRVLENKIKTLEAVIEKLTNEKK